jgi:putative aldouronate transport system permease protein
LARPVVAVVVLWTAVWHWNSWFDAMIYIYDNNKMVLQILVRRLIEQITATEEMQEYEEDLGVVLPPESVKAATVLVTVGPIIFLYPVIQRHFIKGIMLGSLKG